MCMRKQGNRTRRLHKVLRHDKAKPMLATPLHRHARSAIDSLICLLASAKPCTASLHSPRSLSCTLF